MCQDPVNKGRANGRCALRMTPCHPSGKQSSLLPSKRTLALERLTSQYSDGNLPQALATLGCNCLQLLNLEKAIPGLPTVHDKGISQAWSFSVSRLSKVFEITLGW